MVARPDRCNLPERDFGPTSQVRSAFVGTDASGFALVECCIMKFSVSFRAPSAGSSHGSRLQFHTQSRTQELEICRCHYFRSPVLCFQRDNGCERCRLWARNRECLRSSWLRMNFTGDIEDGCILLKTEATFSQVKERDTTGNRWTQEGEGYDVLLGFQ